MPATFRREAAREKARLAMRDVASKGALITYKELVDRIGAYNPRSPSFQTLLTEIALDEHRAGRGMLSAVVVRNDTKRPGDGFFEFAETELGRKLHDRNSFWEQELCRVYDAHQEGPRVPVAERAISVRLDPEAERALDLLVTTGMTRSEAIRQALVESAGRARRSALAEEARSLSEDPDDRAAIDEIATFMDALIAEG